MKLSRFFAVALLAVLAFASNAQAMQTTENYGETSGLLNPNTQVIITYSGLPTGTLYDLAQYGDNGLSYTIRSHTTPTDALTSAYSYDDDNGNIKLDPKTLPVLVTASIDSALGTGTATIKNLSSTVVNFFSYFVGRPGIKTIQTNAEFSAVPLPPAFVMFALGLVSLVGFGMYKKARDQA